MPTYNGTSEADVLEGDQNGVEDDELRGQEGDDVIIGGGGTNTLIGGEGHDLIFADGIRDTIYADGHPSLPSSSNDYNTVHLGFYLGAATVLGGAVDGGAEYFETDPDSLIFHGVTFNYESLDASFTGFELVSGTINGTSGDDRLSLISLSSEDLLECWVEIRGGSGNDYVEGGNFRGRIFGGGGNDQLTGGLAADEIDGGTGNDFIFGGDGDNLLFGGGGADTVVGGWNEDIIYGNAGDDELLGDLGHDRLDGGTGFDSLDGGEGDDILQGGWDFDILAGDWGNDTFLFIGSDGINSIDGGEDREEAFSDGIGWVDKLDLSGITDPNMAVVVDLYNELWRMPAMVATDSRWIQPIREVEHVIGTPFDDTMYAANERTVFEGGGGNDLLVGGSGGDIISGDNGNDTLSGGDGVDTLRGGAGTDTLYGGAGNDLLIMAPSEAIDNVDGGVGHDTLTMQSYSPNGNGVILNLHLGRWSGFGGTNLSISGIESFELTQDIDTVRGSSADETIFAYGGNDVVYGGLGNDTIYGGDGDDSLIGEGMTGTNATDSNRIYGGNGNDRIAGSYGIDHLDGEGGIDTLISSGIENVTINLQTGIATGGPLAGDTFVSFENVQGSQGHDTLIGDNVDNVLWGFSGGDNLQGFGGADRLFGGEESDTLDGGEGNDWLEGGGGLDTVSGGSGDDTIVLTNFEYWVEDYNFNGVMDPDEVFWGADGIDNVAGGDGSDTLDLSRLAPPFGFSSAMVINLSTGIWSGLGGSGTITGIERVLGSQDIDTITGGRNADILDGQGGDDSINGGIGDDILFGGAGLDTLNGGAGADDMRGGAGDDSYFLLEAGDLVTELDGEGIDYVRSGVNLTLGANVENLRLAGSATIGTGNALANTLFGGREGATLAGLDGDDTIYGSNKADTITGDNGADTLFGNSGVDTIHGGAANDTINGGGNGDFLYGDDGDDQLRGFNGNDQLFGGNGNDTLRGELNNDTLHGGSGNDTLLGNDGIDILIGGADRDIMTGGLGADDFVFDEGDFAGLTLGTADRIVDFNGAEGDDIDLSAIDAILGGADDAFTYRGNAAFSSVAGQVRWAHEGANTMIYLDIDGDATADYAIRLDGNINLLATSFIL